MALSQRGRGRRPLRWPVFRAADARAGRRRRVRPGGWDVQHGDGHPGFVSYNSDNGWTTDYEATSDERVELVIIDRTWHGVRPSDVELAQEFRLLFNLWEDRATRTFYDFDDSGNPIKAVIIEERGVRALTSLVRRCQAAKQMYLALYLDSTLWSAELPNEDHHWETRDAQLICGYYRNARAVLLDDRPFSRLLGKRLFAPPSRDVCGIGSGIEHPAVRSNVVQNPTSRDIHSTHSVLSDQLAWTSIGRVFVNRDNSS